MKTLKNKYSQSNIGKQNKHLITQMNTNYQVNTYKQLIKGNLKNIDKHKPKQLKKEKNK